LGDRAGGNNNGTGLGNAQIDLAVNAPIQTLRPKIFSFTANTNFVYLGRSATLSWHVSNATSVVISPDVGAVALEASAEVSPTVTTTYTLTATNEHGPNSSDVTIQVDPGIPLGVNLSTNTPRNTPVTFGLSGFDPQGSNLVFSIITPPYPWHRQRHPADGHLFTRTGFRRFRRVHLQGE